MNRCVVALPLALLLACGGGPPPEPAVPAGMVRDTGRVAVTGFEGRVDVVLTGDEGAVTLRGDLVPELRRLTGATVIVDGTPASGPGTVLDVSRYEILEINGERPRVGTLVRLEDGWAFDVQGGQRLTLDRLPAPLEGHAGAKLWINGVAMDGRLYIVSYGIITPGNQLAPR